MIKVINAGLYTSIQSLNASDSNRFYGFPIEGPLDHTAAISANQIVGNQESAPVIECTFKACSLIFEYEATIALTGANMGWKINEKVVSRYEPVQVKSGDVLKGGYASDGVRAYISVQGKMSLSNETEKLVTNRMECIVEPTKSINYEVEDLTPSNYSNTNNIEFLRGPEWNVLTQEAKLAFMTKPFQVSADSDRMGAKLIGDNLELKQSTLPGSVPVFPGIIQLPNQGKPIVLQQDCQTTGGYPRIGFISQIELSKFSQIRPGQSFYFHLRTERSIGQKLIK